MKHNFDSLLILYYLFLCFHEGNLLLPKENDHPGNDEPNSSRPSGGGDGSNGSTVNDNPGGAGDQSECSTWVQQDLHTQIGVSAWEGHGPSINMV